MRRACVYALRPMNPVERLHDWFERGLLVRPAHDVPSTVDLVRAIATTCGVAGFDGPEVDAVRDEIGDPRHLIFVLVDGLGMTLLDHLGPRDALRRNVRRTIHAVFPSTTASALTSVASGEWPAEHCIPGWWTRVPSAGVCATVLPFLDRFSGVSLDEVGVTLGELFRRPSLIGRYERSVCSLVPKRYGDSRFTRYSAGDGEVIGYGSLESAVAQIEDRVGSESGETYTYLYFDEVDSLSHNKGPSHSAVEGAVRRVNRCISRLATATRGRATIVVSADHGHIEVPQDRLHWIANGDPLLAHLADPPAGEPRVPMFRVQPGASRRFEEDFEERFGHRFALLTIEEVDELRLFGPGPLSAESRRRIGDYIAVSADPDVIIYRGSGRPPRPMRGYHAGMLPAEMEIPLIVFGGGPA